MQKQRLKIAIQKKGRLLGDSIDLLTRCGLKFRVNENALIARVENLSIDILFVRDDDIPILVMDGVCDLGIVGENVLLEKDQYQRDNEKIPTYKLIKKLGFGKCHLAIALPKNKLFRHITDLAGLCIATSYPNLLKAFLNKNKIKAEILTISGSVEITPRLGIADAICDLISTGRTLDENNLKEAISVVDCQAVIIQSTHNQLSRKIKLIDILLKRLNGVIKARESKYIMFHAPKAALPKIKKLLPGFETPTIMPLEGFTDKVAVHVVSREGVFWKTLEKLKQAKASSILVLPIEKMLE